MCTTRTHATKRTGGAGGAGKRLAAHSSADARFLHAQGRHPTAASLLAAGSRSSALRDGPAPPCA
jgi:hypothetical protein